MIGSLVIETCPVSAVKLNVDAVPTAGESVIYIGMVMDVAVGDSTAQGKATAEDILVEQSMVIDEAETAVQQAVDRYADVKSRLAARLIGDVTDDPL